MADTTPELTLVTQGLSSSDGTGLIRKGLSAPLFPLPALPRDVRPATTPDLLRPGAGPVVLFPQYPTTVFDVNGVAVPPPGSINFGPIDLGSGRKLTFNQHQEGLIIPSPEDTLGAFTSANGTRHILDDGQFTFTGSDVRIAIEFAEPVAGATRVSKQLMEATTLTVSVFRVKSPVQAAGFINSKGFSRGRRTVAGTLALTKFTTEVLFRFLSSGAFELSADSHYVKVDQLPPFNLTILFCDEWGHASYQRLLRVEFVTDGSIYSIQDMLTEQTLSYLAVDFTPLLPLHVSSLYLPPKKAPRAKTPLDCQRPNFSQLLTPYPSVNA